MASETKAMKLSQSLTLKSTDTQAYLGETVGLVSDYSNKVSIGIKQVIFSLVEGLTFNS